MSRVSQYIGNYSTKNSSTGVDSSTYAVMPDISIHVSGVHKLLSDLNPFKATGSDTISACFLKERANELASMHEINQSLATGA